MFTSTQSIEPMSFPPLPGLHFKNHMLTSIFSMNLMTKTKSAVLKSGPVFFNCCLYYSSSQRCNVFVAGTMWMQSCQRCIWRTSPNELKVTCPCSPCCPNALCAGSWSPSSLWTWASSCLGSMRWVLQDLLVQVSCCPCASVLKTPTCPFEIIVQLRLSPFPRSTITQTAFTALQESSRMTSSTSQWGPEQWTSSWP